MSLIHTYIDIAALETFRTCAKHIFDQDIADAVRRNSPIMYTGEKLNTLRTWKASYEREQASLFSRVLRKFSR